MLYHRHCARQRSVAGCPVADSRQVAEPRSQALDGPRASTTTATTNSDDNNNTNDNTNN